MGWCVDLIPRQGNESPEAAVDRVYPGFFDDHLGEPADVGSPVCSGTNGALRVCCEQWRWMLSAVDELLDLEVGLHVVGLERESHGGGSDLITLESDAGALHVQVWSDCLSLHPFGYPETAAHWLHWWKVIRHFARQEFVVVLPDPMEIWSVPLSACASRARADACLF